MFLPMSMAGLRLMTAADPLEEFNEIQGENMTGNHYRNHFIKVPTAPGEPCRGVAVQLRYSTDRARDRRSSGSLLHLGRIGW